MPNNSYVSLGFGTGMHSVDMMAWHGQGEDVFKAVDYWSTKKFTPDPDPIQNLDTTYEATNDGARVTFITKRKLDTGDTE